MIRLGRRAPTRRRVAIGIAALVVAASALGPTAHADTRAQTPARADLELVSQDPWTPLGGDLHARVRVTGAEPSAATLHVAVHETLTSRSRFDDTTADRSLGSMVDEVDLPFARLPATPDGRDLTLGLQDPSGAQDAARLAVRRQGVYPMAVELRDGSRTLSRFVTYLVVIAPGLGGQAIAERLGVAWVWPLSAAPSTLPDGSPDTSVLAQLRTNGRLDRHVSALADTDARLTVVPGGDTLDAWTVLARGGGASAAAVTDLQASLGHVQVLDNSYVPIDLPSLLANDMGGAADAGLVRGDDSLTRFFAGRVDRDTALARPVDPAALGRLRARGVVRYVVDASALAPAPSRYTPAAPFALAAPASVVPGGAVSAVVSDDGLRGLLTSDAPAALRAQRFLAGLSVISQEQPNRPRAITVVNPEGFDPPAALLSAVLSGLSSHPLLETMTLDDVFNGVPPATGTDDMPGARVLAAYPPPKPPVSAFAYNQTQTRLDGFRSLVGAHDRRVAGGDRSLLISVSSAFQGTNRGRAQLAAVDATINDVVAKIQVPAPSTITLTSRSGEIPLTFRNETGQPVEVSVQVASQKLFFPEGATQKVTLPPRSTTLQVAVEARTSGSFPFRLVVSSADGRLEITDRQFRVRSTFVSTVGIGLTVGAGLFLVLWWGIDIRRRRHRRRRGPAPAPGPTPLAAP